ncbi:hypothetical protein [Lautropia mirabilis]|uniref:hypothetical protein n=1 Tax=Lautropia mirabilis TaxID=47671 RepID=UPI00288BCADA|nr:hypothetical protein [Lautropia mirabilis]
MTPQTGSHPGNALTPHDILRRDVLRHARAAYRHAKEGVPADETPEHLKLAQASTPEAQEDDDDDKAALWLPSGTGAGAATEAAAMTEAGAAASTAGTIGTTAATGSALLGPSILGAFAMAAGANLQDNGPLHNISARNRLSTGHDSSREDANAGTEGQSSVAAPSTDTAPLATGTAPTAPSRPTNEGTQAEASRTPAVADAAAAASTEPAAPSAPDTPTADASKPAEGSDGNALPQVKPLPAYSENASVSYAHGENKALGATVFSGSNDETAPAFVRITAIQGKDGEAAAGTMSLLGGNAIVPNQVISRADFDKVVWDASKNEGGSFSFVPVQDAQGTALPGALEQTVTIHEAPALPTYEADMSVAYTYNQNKAVGADIFNGTDSATAPSFVRITAIQGKDGDAAANTMSLKDGDALTVGSVVPRADFDKVIWDASKNEGGSFKFIPVQDAQGTTLPGAMEQTVTIHEAPALPTYEADMSVAYTYNQSKAVGADIFNGTDSATAPAFVRITAIQGKDGEAAAHTMSLQGGDALTAGSVVARADFDKVVWDASKNEGGSFKFIPVQDAQGTALPGAVERSVTIQEGPALPTYEADMSVAYTYNQSKAVGADIFNGTDSATAPAFVRITAIQGKDGEAAAHTMSLQGGDALTAGSVVSRADFDKVVWDASKNEGGSFKFIPVQDAQGTALPGAIEQTVSINEGRPMFHIPAGNFDLVDRYPDWVSEHPAYVKVTNIVEANDTNGILDALVLGEDGGTVLKNGDIIRAEDFGRVYWHHASNDGGSLTVTPYNANDRMIDPGPYPMELEPSWKTPDKKSLPAHHHEQEATDASPELVGVAHPATDGLMPLWAQAQYPGMTLLAMSSSALLDSLLEQHPGTTGLL